MEEGEVGFDCLLRRVCERALYIRALDKNVVHEGIKHTGTVGVAHVGSLVLGVDTSTNIRANEVPVPQV